MNFYHPFNNNIVFTESKINFISDSGTTGDKNFKLEGKVKLSEKFEKIKISHIYQKKSKIYNTEVSLGLTNSSVNISKLNYTKEKNVDAKLDFSFKYILDKYFLINSLNYIESQSAIVLNSIKLNKLFKIDNFKSITVKTYNKSKKNNDFSINKSDQIYMSGYIFDSGPILKELVKKKQKQITQ